MAVLLVTYDLRKPGQDYDDLYKAIKSYPWARLSESSYAVDTTEPPDTLFRELRNHMDSNDQLYIINLTRPYSGFGPQDVNNWLEQHLLPR